MTNPTHDIQDFDRELELSCTSAEKEQRLDENLGLAIDLLRHYQSNKKELIFEAMEPEFIQGFYDSCDWFREYVDCEINHFDAYACFEIARESHFKSFLYLIDRYSDAMRELDACIARMKKKG